MAASFTSAYAHITSISQQVAIDKATSIDYSTPFNTIASQVFGYLSIFCWVCVSMPQLYENWRLKSSDSVSLAFVMIWAIGDIFNFVGSLVQGLVLTAILLAGYYLLSDILLLTQVAYYRLFATHHSENEDIVSESSPLLKPHAPTHGTSSDMAHRNSSLAPEESTSPITTLALKSVLVLLIFIVPLCILLAEITPQPSVIPESLITSEPEEGVWWAAIMGWISTFLFCAAKVPQIWLNYTRKSTEGLSMTMFIFCCLGNLTYILSIVVYAHDLAYLDRNLPWLMGATLPFFFDFTIIGQSYIYRDAPSSVVCV